MLCTPLWPRPRSLPVFLPMKILQDYPSYTQNSTPAPCHTQLANQNLCFLDISRGCQAPQQHWVWGSMGVLGLGEGYCSKNGDLDIFFCILTSPTCLFSHWAEETFEKTSAWLCSKFNSGCIWLLHRGRWDPNEV